MKLFSIHKVLHITETHVSKSEDLIMKMAKEYLHIAKACQVLDFDGKTNESYQWEPGVAFCTAELKKASLKKSREPLKTTLALFLA